jgi:hypothetical protein
MRRISPYFNMLSSLLVGRTPETGPNNASAASEPQLLTIRRAREKRL